MRKVGEFLIMLGVLLVALYLLSDMAHSPNPLLLIFGGLILVLGIWLRINHKPEEKPQSSRFQRIRQRKESSARPKTDKKKPQESK